MRGRWVAAGAIVFGMIVAALRVLGMAGFANDHFYYLSRAEQVLHGAWPVRDFIDPGIPLAWLLSLAAQIVGGHSLLSEAVLVAIAFGVSAALTVWFVASWTGRAWLGFWAGFVELAVMPRSYSYPKILVYAVAVVAFLRYARKPSTRTIVLLAAVTAVAFLFRHDHGVYVGAASCLLVAGLGETPGLSASFRRVARFLALSGLMVVPYLMYVAVVGNLGMYFEDGLRFSEREAARTMLRFPGFDGAALWSADGLSVLAYYAFWLAPLIAAGAAWRVKTLSPATRWSVTTVSAMALIMNPGLLRDPLTSRVPETIVPFTLLAAWMASRLWSTPSSPTLHRMLRVTTVALLVAVAAAAGTVGHFEETLERAELLRRPPRPELRWREVSAQLREPFAERQMPSDAAFALVPFFEYVQACTPSTARILVVGSLPEASYYARRGFAGGQPALDAVYYSSPALQRRIVEQLQRELVLFMVAPPDGMQVLSGSYPIVDAYVKGRFVPMAEFPVDGFDSPARVYVNRGLAPGPTYRETGWPCPGTGR